MTTKVAVQAIGFHHHRHRIPTHIGTQTFFNFQITWAVRLYQQESCSHRRCCSRTDIRTTTTRQIHHAFHQIVSAVRAFRINHSFQCIAIHWFRSRRDHSRLAPKFGLSVTYGLPIQNYPLPQLKSIVEKSLTKHLSSALILIVGLGSPCF